MVDLQRPAAKTALQKTRPEIIAEVDAASRFDVVVVGGGIHGASVARLAVVQGFSTLLLERADYAEATSGRSSRMLHGGLRYLESFDFRQVMEGARCRDELLNTAPHITKKQEFVFPVENGASWKKLKVGLGLSLYGLFSHSLREHRWCSRTELDHEFGLASLSNIYGGGFLYSDGTMSDRRLVIESILSARQEGALCLNYAEVEVVSSFEADQHVIWRDVITKDVHKVKAGIVVNCCGAWAPNLGRLSSKVAGRQVVYSRGSHLLFKKRWEHPALIMPLAEQGRYYFVWPSLDGESEVTMVGTTERPIGSPDRDPHPSQDEVDEILDNLERDLPTAGLNRATLFSQFAGVRTMAISKGGVRSANDTARISRRHRWSYSNGVLTLLGGKFTTAMWTAQEGLQKIADIAELSSPLISLDGRKFPGAVSLDETRDKFHAECSANGVSARTAQILWGNFGSLVRFFPQGDGDWRELAPGVTTGAVRYCIQTEQASCLSDILAQRLSLDRLPPLDGAARAELEQFINAELSPSL